MNIADDVRKPDAPALLITAAAFGVLAVIGFGCAFLGNSSARVLYTHYATIALPATPRDFQLFTAVASAVSAAAYVALLHWFAQAVDKSFIIAQFVLFTIGTALFALTLAGLNSALEQENVTVFVAWHLRIFWVGSLVCRIGLRRLRGKRWQSFDESVSSFIELAKFEPFTTRRKRALCF